MAWPGRKCTRVRSIACTGPLVPAAIRLVHTENPVRLRTLVDNEKCIFSDGCDLAQMWMIYHFDDITVTRADGRSLGDQNLKDIEQQISEDIYADFNEEEDDELRLEFRASAGNMSLWVDFLRQY